MRLPHLPLPLPRSSSPRPLPVALSPYGKLPVRPWPLAAAWRTPPEPPLHVTLHTFQTREAYEILARAGVLVGDSARGWDGFQEAYGWMLRQMARRELPGPTHGLLWAAVDGTNWRLRDMARRARGDVLLSIRVPRQNVLISEFMDWHMVLNRAFHTPMQPGESLADWEARWAPVEEDFAARAEAYRDMPLGAWPDSLRQELESSWEAIFDPATWQSGLPLQATMHMLRAEAVIRAVRVW